MRDVSVNSGVMGKQLYNNCPIWKSSIVSGAPIYELYLQSYQWRFATCPHRNAPESGTKSIFTSSMLASLAQRLTMHLEARNSASKCSSNHSWRGQLRDFFPNLCGLNSHGFLRYQVHWAWLVWSHWAAANLNLIMGTGYRTTTNENLKSGEKKHGGKKRFDCDRSMCF